uniref:Probable RNA-binding protein EIF1AD n=1 Tax=Coturnix japonica TaxID=93934 RepID=A0A8C2SRJ1_COTJA
MSRATKRKHVTREVLEEHVVPTPQQRIVRVLSSPGNNLHEVEASDGSRFLVSMPARFRHHVWIKRGTGTRSCSLTPTGRPSARRRMEGTQERMKRTREMMKRTQKMEGTRGMMKTTREKMEGTQGMTKPGLTKAQRAALRRRDSSSIKGWTLPGAVVPQKGFAEPELDRKKTKESRVRAIPLSLLPLNINYKSVTTLCLSEAPFPFCSPVFSFHLLWLLFHYSVPHLLIVTFQHGSLCNSIDTSTSTYSFTVKHQLRVPPQTPQNPPQTSLPPISSALFHYQNQNSPLAVFF